MNLKAKLSSTGKRRTHHGEKVGSGGSTTAAANKHIKPFSLGIVVKKETKPSPKSKLVKVLEYVQKNDYSETAFNSLFQLIDEVLSTICLARDRPLVLLSPRRLIWDDVSTSKTVGSHTDCLEVAKQLWVLGDELHVNDSLSARNASRLFATAHDFILLSEEEEAQGLTRGFLEYDYRRQLGAGTCTGCDDTKVNEEKTNSLVSEFSFLSLYRSLTSLTSIDASLTRGDGGHDAWVRHCLSLTQAELEVFWEDVYMESDAEIIECEQDLKNVSQHLNALAVDIAASVDASVDCDDDELPTSSDSTLATTDAEDASPTPTSTAGKLIGVTIADASLDADGLSSLDAVLGLPRRGLCAAALVDIIHFRAQPSTNIPRGMRNLGNSCFMNATTQCLANLPLLRDCLLSLPSAELEHNNKPLALLRDLVAVQEESAGGRSEVIVPTGLFEYLPDLCKFNGGNSLVSGEQSDAHEYLQQLLEGARHSLLKASGIDESAKGWEHRLLVPRINETTLIDRMFFFHQQSRTSCGNPGCNNISSGYISTLEWRFDIDTEGVFDLQDAVDGSSQPECRDEWLCEEGCNAQHPATTSTRTIHRPAPLLTITLNRLRHGYDNDNCITSNRLHKTTSYPAVLRVKLSDGSISEYKLNSLTCHVPHEIVNELETTPASSGHYVAYLVRGSRCFCANDSIIKTVSRDTVMAQGGDAYLLFYELVLPGSAAASSAATSDAGREPFQELSVNQNKAEVPTTAGTQLSVNNAAADDEEVEASPSGKGGRRRSKRIKTKVVTYYGADDDCTDEDNYNGEGDVDVTRISKKRRSSRKRKRKSDSSGGDDSSSSRRSRGSRVNNSSSIANNNDDNDDEAAAANNNECGDKDDRDDEAAAATGPVPLPHRVTAPLPDGIDRDWFRPPTQEVWDKIPGHIQPSVVNHFDVDSDPVGLALRRNITVFDEASGNRGWLRIILAMKRNCICQYGIWDYNDATYYYDYKPMCRETKHTKVLNANLVDDFEGKYEPGVYYSDGKEVKLSLKDSDMAFVSTSKASPSDFDEDKFDVVEVEIHVQRYIEHNLKLPCSKKDTFDKKYVRYKKHGKWADAPVRMMKSNGSEYLAFTFTTESKKKFQFCEMAFVPVILNGGGPVLIQADAAHLVHKNDLTCNMIVRSENLTFDAMHGKLQMPNSYWRWLDPASLKRASNSSSGDDGNARKKSKTTTAAPQQTKNIRKEDATDVDIFCVRGKSVHIGNRKYKAEVMLVAQDICDSNNLTKGEKTAKMDALFELIRSKGMRFLERQGGSNLWKVVDDKKARKKVRADISDAKRRGQ